MPYLMKRGHGKAIALYTRCEDELWAKAELLLLRERASADYPGKPIVAYLDVDPTFTIDEFKKSYRKRPGDYARLMLARSEIIANGWQFPTFEPGEPLE